MFKTIQRKHALKYQSIVSPEGIIIHLYGPIPGSRHDSFLLHESGLKDTLAEVLVFGDSYFHIYGDPAYGRQDHILSGFKGANLTEAQEEFNRRMSAVRVCVEWEFGRILRDFAFLDFAKNQKLYLQPVGKMYPVAVLLSNIRVCMEGSQSSMFFGIDVPTPQEYLHTMPKPDVLESESSASE